MKQNFKFKKSVFVFLLMAACVAASTLAYRKIQLHEELEVGAEMGEAAKQNFLMTQDPALGYPPSERMASVREMYEKRKTGRFPSSGVNWEERGPGNLGGRTRAVMFDPHAPDKVWAGGVSGGLWYTNDITQTNPIWRRVDDFWDNLAVSAIAYDPSSPNQNTYYVGTGEGYIIWNAVKGGGIWQTTDGGGSWSGPMPSTTGPEFDYIQDIAVTSNGIILVATYSGGIQRSTDGGLTWTKKLGSGMSVTDLNPNGTHTVFTDAVADLEIASDGKIYATLGIGSCEGVFRSDDNGFTWLRLTASLSGFDQSTNYNRVEIACAPSNAAVLYAITTWDWTMNHAWKHIYYSNDRGFTWTEWTTSSPGLNPFAWYNVTLAVDPSNENIIYANTVLNIFCSLDNGEHWSAPMLTWHEPNPPTTQDYVHSDQQAMVFKPGSSSEMLIATDGGLFYSSNINGANIPDVEIKNSVLADGYRTSQFYSCAMDPTANSNFFMGGTQDNGVQIFDQGSPGISDASTWEMLSDGGYCFIDLDMANPAYIGSTQFTNFYLSNTGLPGSFQANLITANGNSGRFITAADYDYYNHYLYTGRTASSLEWVRGIDTPPIIHSLIPIPGMTTNPSFIKVFQNANPNTTLYIGTGPDPGTGSGGGELFIVFDVNASTIAVPIPPPIPPTTGLNISCIDIGATINDLLITYSNYGVISVWETHNGGATWENKEGSLVNHDMPIRWALYNPHDRREVFLGTEAGVWSTTNIDASFPDWGPTDGPFATTRVDMLRYRASDNMVLVATYGRGLWSTMFFNHPVANFSFPSSGVCNGSMTFQFTDQSTLPNPAYPITSWSWDFGDGTTSILQNPSHTYTNPGTYSVTLTVSNQYGTGTVTQTVSIDTWVKKVGNDLNSDFGGDVLVLPSGEVLITGSFIGSLTLNNITVTSGTTPDIYVAKLNSNGIAQWIQVLHTSPYNIVDPKPNAITVDVYGNILVAASGKFNIYFAKMDANGSLLWERSFRQQTWQGINKGVTGAYDICTDANGDVYVVGTMGGGITFDGTNLTDVTYPRGIDWFLAKFNSIGKFKWVQHEPGKGNGVVESSGKIIITGMNASSNVLFRAYDAFASIWWDYPQGVQSHYSSGNDICKDPSGNIYLIGHFYDVAQFGTSFSLLVNLTSAGRSDIFVAKYDANVNLLWANQFGGISYDQGNAIYAEDQEVFVTGFFSDNVSFPTGTLTANGPSDIFTMGIQSSGTTNWVTRYGGIGDNDAGNGIYTDANSIYEIGNFTDVADFGVGTNGLTTTAFYYGAYLKKICKSDPSQRISSFELTTTDEQISIQLSPNPTSGYITLKVSNLFDEPFTLKVFNMQGEICMIQNRRLEVPESIPLDLSKFSKGIYFVKVETKDKSGVERIVLQ